MKVTKKQSFFVRGIDPEIWKKARIRSIEEDRSMQEVVRKLIELWATGKVKLK